MVRMLPLAGVVFLSSFAHADVLNVGGPNPDYATISGAVEMALDGDVVRVWPSTTAYDSFTVDGKSVSIVPDQSINAIAIRGFIRVINLNASQSVELVGLSPSGLLKFIASNNLGAVRVTDCRFVWPGTAATGNGQVVDVLSCENVSFVDCVVAGQDGTSVFSGPAGPADRGVRVIHSDVAFYGCSLSGGDGGDVFSPGLPFSTPPGGRGGDALTLLGSGSLFVSNSTVAGGMGGDGWSFGNWAPAADGFSINAINANYAISYANNVLSGWFTGSTGVLAPAPSTQTTLAGVGLLLQGSRWIYDNDVIDVEVTGDVGAPVGLYFSTAYGRDFAALGGPLLVDVPMGPRPPRWLFLGRIGPSGTLQVSIPMRDLPAFGHIKLHMTAMSITQTGRRNSNSFSPLVLDTAW